MQKFLIIFLFFSCTLFSKVNATENIIDSNDVASKVDSLGNQIDFLKLSYEIYTLNTDLKIFTYDVNSQIKDMKISIYHRDCDRDMYRMYSKLYDSYRDNLESIKGLIEAKQRLFVAMMLSREWTDGEQEVLYKSYGMTKGLYNQAELTLDMMKDILDIYRKQM